MRNKLRIPIILDLMLNKETLLRFLNTSSQKLIDNLYNNWEEITEEWDKCSDYRLGQLLVNLNLIPSKEIEDHIWNIEEDDWLVKNGYCNIEDIKFWGVNYYKNGKKRKTIKFVLLKDLKIDHIQNIIKFFKDQDSLHKLNKEYLEYFNKRINDGK